jgi:hypothetical protein
VLRPHELNNLAMNSRSDSTTDHPARASRSRTDLGTNPPRDRNEKGFTTDDTEDTDQNSLRMRFSHPCRP